MFDALYQSAWPLMIQLLNVTAQSLGANNYQGRSYALLSRYYTKGAELQLVMEILYQRSGATPCYGDIILNGRSYASLWRYYTKEAELRIIMEIVYQRGGAMPRYGDIIPKGQSYASLWILYQRDGNMRCYGDIIPKETNSLSG
jgi:hypothetical protein